MFTWQSRNVCDYLVTSEWCCVQLWLGNVQKRLVSNQRSRYILCWRWTVVLPWHYGIDYAGTTRRISILG